jgi:TrmH family RNA methyltransferase
MEKITSRSNEKIKQASALLNSSKARQESGLFLLEGARLCEDAAKNGIEIERLFFTVTAAGKYSERLASVFAKASECYEIPEDISLRLSDTQSPQGVFCVCRVQKKSNPETALDYKGRYIALENIQDPSNLGAVSRAAEALGISGLIVSGGCDIYNPKAQRAAMGSLLRISVIPTENLASLLIFSKQKGMLTLASTPDSGAVSISDVKPEGGAVLVVGNEGSGITREVMDICSIRVTIPMKGRAQSMNAAAAAAILMWELVK